MLKIINKITAGIIREVCVENNYFTLGDNETYSKLLQDFDDRKMGVISYEFLAERIKSHSVTEDRVIDIATKLLHASIQYMVEDNE